MGIEERSHELAEEVFARGREFLLAHAVQATERMISERRKKPFIIQVIEKPRIQAVLGHRALVFFREDSAEIKVDQSLELEQQRRGVAHELGHILLAAEMVGVGLGLPNRANPEHEAWCRDFEVHLCKLLHVLYTKTDFTKKSQCPSLDELCEQQKDYLFTRMEECRRKRTK